MKVSVVVAAYNGEKFIEQQLRSILCQTSPPDEIVVRDDVSTDGTVKVVEWLRDEERLPIKLIRGETNLGYAKNFIEAISHAGGDYIFLADQDDYWLPGKIDTFMQAFARQPRPMVLIADQMIADERLSPTGVTTIQNTLRSGRGLDSFVHGCCTAFDSRIVGFLSLAPHDLGHDDWIHMIGASLGRRVVLRDVCQLYRRHASTVTSSSVNQPRAVTRSILRPPVLFRGAIATREVVANLSKRAVWLERLEQVLSGPKARHLDPALARQATVKLNEERHAVARRIDNICGKHVARWQVAACFWRGDYPGLKGVGVALRDVLSEAASLNGKT